MPRPFGGYVLLKALGRGAMGDVFLARPYNPNRGIPTPIVVKRLHGELAGKKGFVARFKHEAAVAVSVDSPHVARVYDVGAVGDTLYIAMEYVRGWPLSKVLDAILKSGRHASIASVIDSVCGGLLGLSALHEAQDPESGLGLGIVHRDISPKNLMIGEDGRMHIIDLGLGKSNVQEWKTRTGVVMGSVGYMPPEQAAGEHVDARADVYAMGVVSFEMLALRNYIKRGTLQKMMEDSTRPRFQRPSTFRPDVPPGLDEVIERAVHPDKNQRFLAAADFHAALREVVPERATEGGMRALVEELFGETRIEREREIEALLALPLPLEDPSELEPTKVFVQRAGVHPHEPSAQVTTQERALVTDGPTVPPTVATELHGARAPLGGRVASEAGDRLPSITAPPELGLFAERSRGSSSPELVAPVRDERPQGRAPGGSGLASRPVEQQPHGARSRSPRGGVSLVTMLAGMLMSAVVSAVVAVLVVQHFSQTQAPVSPPLAPVSAEPPPERRPTVGQRRPAHEDEEPEAPVEEARVVRTRPPPRRTERAAIEVGAGTPTPPPVGPSLEDLRGVFDALLERTDELISRLPEGSARNRARNLRSRIHMNRKSTDPEQLRKNAQEIERELRVILGG